MPDGPPPPPAVQRLRLRYAKRGRLRFSSHRDFQRALERALRRAEVPMAYSAGFSPHPKISYANAASTGAGSEAEYVELAVTRRCDVARLREALDAALPPELVVLEVVEAAPGALADRLQASLWRIELPGCAPQTARAAVAAFLAASAVEVERMTKNGPRRFDARAAVVRLEVAEVTGGGADQAGGDVAAHLEQRAESPIGSADPSGVGLCAILQLVVRHTTPSVRPDDVLAALRSVASFAPPSSPRMTRLAQGPLDESDGSVADPLATDREAVGS